MEHRSELQKTPGESGIAVAFVQMVQRFLLIVVKRNVMSVTGCQESQGDMRLPIKHLDRGK